MHRFHFIYLFGKNTCPFNINHYLSVISNLILNDAEAFIWTNDKNRLRECGWMKVLMDELSSRISIVDADVIYDDIQREIGQDLNKLPYMAHCADMLRLYIMNKYGGAYSDVDSIAVRKLPESWWDSVPIFCTETNSLDCLCNGFFLSPKNNNFLKDWLLGWKFYNPNECKPGTPDWTKYSVQYGYETFLKYKNEVKILTPDAFQPFYLTYDDTLDLFFLDKLLDIQLNPDVYEVHLWETRNQPILKLLNERYFLEGKSTYSQLGRIYL